MLYFSLIMTGCTPGKSPVNPPARNPEHPNTESGDTQREPENPKPPDPVDLPGPTGEKAPEPPTGPTFVAHPELKLRKIGSLSREVGSLAIHPKCTAVAAGAPQWELARFGADGKQHWNTRKGNFTVTCPPKNRCDEIPRARFLANDNIIAAMDGDSLRQFNRAGRVQSFRGGFLEAVLDFGISPDSRLAGALYSHGLGLWRTAGGLLQKKEVDGASRFLLRNRTMVTADRNKLNFMSHDFKSFRTQELDGAVVDLSGTGHIWVLTNTRAYRYDDQPIPPISFSLAPDSRPLHLVTETLPPMVLAIREGNLVLQKRAEETVFEWKLSGVPLAETPVTAAAPGCVAIASGPDVYFLVLPNPMP